MYNPCLECYSRYGHTYSAACDQICDYAQVIKACHEWRMITNLAVDAMNATTRRLEDLFGKEAAADGK